MNLKKTILFLLAGVSVGVGGGLIYRKKRDRILLDRKMMPFILSLSMGRISRPSGLRVSASEIYFFIWVVERVCNRHEIYFPSLGFKVKQGMLASAKMTSILRRMIKEGLLTLEGNYLVLVKEPSEPLPEEDRDALARIAEIIEETAAQWNMDFPDEPLIRFSKLFK
jgi:hypothetical protein